VLTSRRSPVTSSESQWLVPVRLPTTLVCPACSLRVPSVPVALDADCTPSSPIYAEVILSTATNKYMTGAEIVIVRLDLTYVCPDLRMSLIVPGFFCLSGLQDGGWTLEMAF
jgi:hypothetical protein